MATNIVNNYISTMMTIYNDVIKIYERNLGIIKQTEDELNDLNHEIELSSPKDMYKGYLLYKDIRELRIKRRTAKEENELLKDMYEYLKVSPAKHLKLRCNSFKVAPQNYVQRKNQGRMFHVKEMI